MYCKGTCTRFIKIRNFVLLLLFFPVTLHASFIESTLGTAVVNDATAAYYNPASLTFLTDFQIITLGSDATFNSEFTGKSIQSTTGFTQSGSSKTQTRYYLPSLYLGLPAHDKVIFGLAVISDSFNRRIDDNSILRYSQSSNSIKDIDIVPALGIKLNNEVSVGAGVSLSKAHFLLQPISGFPSLNIPDAQSQNKSDGSAIGGDVGLLYKPNSSTWIGFNYRSKVTYHLKGTSILEGNPPVISNDYYFTFWTPARSVLSINHFLTSSLGFISTIQYIQWSIFDEINIHGIATRLATQPIILNAKIPYHLQDSWLFTAGGHYRVTPKWVIRVAANYNQTPEKGIYQISTGDSIILGASMGYDINKNITIDGSFAHAFIDNQPIDIRTGRFLIQGLNRGSRDAVTLKLTFNR